TDRPEASSHAPEGRVGKNRMGCAARARTRQDVAAAGNITPCGKEQSRGLAADSSRSCRLRIRRWWPRLQQNLRVKATRVGGSHPRNGSTAQSAHRLFFCHPDAELLY